MYEKITYYIVIKGLTSTQFERKTYNFCTGRVTSIRIKSMIIRNLEVIYQTRVTVFHWDIQTLRRELKIRRAAEYF